MIRSMWDWEDDGILLFVSFFLLLDMRKVLRLLDQTLRSSKRIPASLPFHLDIRVGTLLDLLSFMACVTLLEASMSTSGGCIARYIPPVCKLYLYSLLPLLQYIFARPSTTYFSPSSAADQYKRKFKAMRRDGRKMYRKTTNRSKPGILSIVAHTTALFFHREQPVSTYSLPEQDQRSG
jgi:hypothetical protein